MKKNFLFYGLLVSLIGCAVSEAGTLGDITWDGNSLEMKNIVTGTKYINLGHTAHLTHNDTVALLNINPLYSGYRIATKDDAYTFYRAIGGRIVNDSATVEFHDTYYPNNSILDGTLGENFDRGSDKLWFYGEDGKEAGRIEISQSIDTGLLVDIPHLVSLIHITKADRSIANTDFFADEGRFETIPIPWLLVSDEESQQSAVPLPASAWLMGLGLLSFLGFTRNRKLPTLSA